MNRLASSHARLWQLISPSLPIGAYAYSRGLEYAVASAWVTDRVSAATWVRDQLTCVLPALDLPILMRLRAGWAQGRQQDVDYWNAYLLASRGTAELVDEERQLGRSLARLLPELGIDRARSWASRADAAYLSMFALACDEWDVDALTCAEAYAWVICEGQVTAAVKLVPLGQTDGQQILADVATHIRDAAFTAAEVTDEAIGALTTGLSLASARHETQYSRLFRS